MGALNVRRLSVSAPQQQIAKKKSQNRKVGTAFLQSLYCNIPADFGTGSRPKSKQRFSTVHVSRSSFIWTSPLSDCCLLLSLSLFPPEQQEIKETTCAALRCAVICSSERRLLCCLPASSGLATQLAFGGGSLPSRCLTSEDRTTNQPQRQQQVVVVSLRVNNVRTKTK